jgi:hypothetical protein
VQRTDAPALGILNYEEEACVGFVGSGGAQRFSVENMLTADHNPK